MRLLLLIYIYVYNLHALQSIQDLGLPVDCLPHFSCPQTEVKYYPVSEGVTCGQQIESPLSCGFLDRDYRHKSRAAQISCLEDAWLLLGCTAVDPTRDRCVWSSETTTVIHTVTKRYGTNFRTHSSHLEDEIMLYEHRSENALLSC